MHFRMLFVCFVCVLHIFVYTFSELSCVFLLCFVWFLCVFCVFVCIFVRFLCVSCAFCPHFRMFSLFIVFFLVCFVYVFVRFL